jgi:DNA mismatch repair protein MutS2
MWHRKTLEDLYYFRVRDSVASFCASEEGRELLETKLPFTESERYEELKDLSRNWETVLTSSSGTGLKGWEKIHSFLKILSVEGTTLEQEQLYAVYEFAFSALDIIESINRCSKTLSIKKLLALTESLNKNELSLILSEISKVLDKDGQLKDLPQLREIRASIKNLQGEIAAALKKYTSDSSLSSVLASNVPAFRADRQVLAVKANQRARISGIVHEVSSSGQTIFIEPDEVVRKNNELIQEEFRLESEKRKIFTELTSKISPYSQALKSSLKIMIKLDQTQAAARWGISNGCTWALSCTDKNGAALPPALIKARHPLLGEKAVPIDMAFLPEKNVLIITGPNTGGKTVSIKTFALFALLNQTGFPLPAADGTRLPCFNSLFADIGDEQSIDQSLSTFSAHMKNIAAAIKHADSKSLVLLDELGSGTDPQEGGAVGMAVLEELIEKKAFTLVTTHHGILKNFGYTNPSCINASVDFDTQTLSPTYSLLMGVPGESHALDIAKRSGLPSSTVKKAKSYITNQQADVSSLIKGLTKKHAELAEIEKTVKQKEINISQKELKLEQRIISLKEREIQLKETEQRSESIWISETRKKLENLVRTLREGEITREKTLAVKNFISELGSSHEESEKKLEEDKLSLEKLKEAVRTENGILLSKDNSKHASNKKTKKKLSNKEALSMAKSTWTDEEARDLEALSSSAFVTKSKTVKTVPLTFEEGAEVEHIQTKAKGTLIEKIKNGVWSVQFGSMRMNIKEKDLHLIASLSKGTTVTLELSGDASGQAKPVFELRLLGMREEEALKALARQLDLCQIHSFKNFSVIHGKGNGILQRSVHDFLEHYPAVKDYHFATPEDGGFGKTYVELI